MLPNEVQGMTPSEIRRWLDLVLPGRECRVCGEVRISRMYPAEERTDGHRTICLRHGREENAARALATRNQHRVRDYYSIGREAPGYVYRAFDAEGRLLYVGETNNLYRRFYWPGRGHADQSEWWPLAVRAEISVYASKEDAQTAEAFLIERLRPPYNRKRGAKRTHTEPEPLLTYSGEFG